MGGGRKSQKPQTQDRRQAHPAARLGSGDEDAGRPFGAGFGVEAYDDFDVAAEATEEMHEALDGETIEAIAGER